jgi:hypothetical protein
VELEAEVDHTDWAWTGVGDVFSRRQRLSTKIIRIHD